MKKANIMKNFLISGLLLGTLSLATGSASAKDFYLCAGETTKTMPDGITEVSMWGYAEDDDDDLTNGCGNPITIPGPRLTVPAVDTDLIIHLRNDLPLLESTSIVIPGMAMPAGGPTWDDGSTPADKCSIMANYPDNCIPSEMAKKVRSFGAETAANNTAIYSWTDVRPGTFIYHSGTYPQKQVYMGLYGAVTQDAVAADTVAGTPAQAYPGVEYFNEVVLFYSEIDPVLNAAVAGGTHETSIDYHAKWFLVNGEPYSTDCTNDGLDFDVASGYPCFDVGTGIGMSQTPNIAAGEANTRTLLRFLSTAGETHVPVLQGMHMTIHAEDGFQYNWQDGATVMGTAPREQYSVMMPPLKTKDAIILAPAAGRYAVYDGNGYMTNPTNTTTDFDHGDPVGGMLRFLEFGSASTQAPVANAGPDQSGSVGTPVAFDGTGSTDDGVIVQYDWDFGDSTVVLDAGATPSHTYATASAVGVPYIVTLTVLDDSGLTGTDTADVTIADNILPTANAGPAQTGLTDAPVTFDGTDSSDPEGSALSYAWDFGDGDVGIGATPSHNYAFDSLTTYPVTYTVTLTVTDIASGVSAPATTTAMIDVNLPPVANAGPDQSGSEVTPVAFDGTGSSDPEVSALSYAWDFGDPNDTTPGTGPTPSHSYAAADLYTVTLTVTDDGGLTAMDTAAVTIAANQLPTANAGPAQPGLTGDIVTFDGTGSSDVDGTIASYEWDFGDGSPITAENALAEPSHIYAFDALETYPVTYPVTLTVTDNAGGVSAEATTDAIIDAANQPPVADAGPAQSASIQPSPCGVPYCDRTVTFDGTGSTDDGTIDSYEWDFGDGSTGTGSMPTHQYPNASGTYIVTLTVTDNGLATDTDTTVAYIVGNQAPVAVNDMAVMSLASDTPPFFVNLTSNDTDLEDVTVNPDSIVITSGPTRGTATVVSGGVAYTPQGGKKGAYLLTYTVKDSKGAVSNEATVTINVTQ